MSEITGRSPSRETVIPEGKRGAETWGLNREEQLEFKLIKELNERYGLKEPSHVAQVLCIDEDHARRLLVHAGLIRSRS